MINVDPNAARRPGLPVPARRDARVCAPSNAGGAGSQDRRDSPQKQALPSPRRVERVASRGAERSVTAAACAAGVMLQADLPNPRRGLRADAVERARYRAAYESAGRQPAPRPSLVRSA
jgi:hypothetical protein